MFLWRSTAPGPVRAFTDRDGGASRAPYAGLNLGAHVGDAVEDVTTNRRLLEDEIGLPTVWSDQVHGTDVLHVTRDVLDGPRTATGALGTADAMVTALPGVALGVLVADCTPVLLHDDQAGLVGVAHAGRLGMTHGIVPAVVSALRDLGARDLQATVGPSVCGRCYEVPPQLRDEAAEVAPTSAAMTWQGTPAIDVAAGVVEQLTTLEVPIEWVPGCAREDESLFSHRRDGTTGRFAGVIGRPS